MTRLRGRAQRGQRVHGLAPHGHWNSTTVIGAMRMDGSTACMTIEGAADTEVFRAYIGQVLGPTLQAGDVVIMDNLSPHKNEGILSLFGPGRGASVVSSGLLAGSQSHRKNVEQSQKLSAERRSQNALDPGRRRGRSPGQRHPSGCHQLVCLLWL